MLPITIPETELYDEINNEYIYVKAQTIRLEHSLVSLSKWESKWCKSFLSNLTNNGLTHDQTIDYIKYMTITKGVDPNVYLCFTSQHYEQINKYISAPMTATYFSEAKSGKLNNEPVTSELVYYWMVTHRIPFECEKWHLNRLLTLIRVCNVKNQPAKKMTTQELISRNAAINAANRKRFNSKG